MKIYKAGDASKAVCEDCQDVVQTTFVYRDMPFDDGHGIAEGVLVSTCDECGSVVAVPAQSIPAIRQARADASASFEVVLPVSEPRRSQKISPGLRA